jgi:fumarate hydratase subunit beta
VKQAMIEHKAVYFAATGGAGALLAKRIVANETIAWPELGAEAVARLEVVDFPVIVVNDCYGGDYYAEGRARYAKSV